MWGFGVGQKSLGKVIVPALSAAQLGVFSRHMWTAGPSHFVYHWFVFHSQCLDSRIRAQHRYPFLAVATEICLALFLPGSYILTPVFHAIHTPSSRDRRDRNQR